MDRQTIDALVTRFETTGVTGPGNPRVKTVVKRLLTDLMYAMEDLDITPEEFWTGLNYLGEAGKRHVRGELELTVAARAVPSHETPGDTTLSLGDLVPEGGLERPSGHSGHLDLIGHQVIRLRLSHTDRHRSLPFIGRFRHSDRPPRQRLVAVLDSYSGRVGGRGGLSPPPPGG